MNHRDIKSAMLVLPRENRERIKMLKSGDNIVGLSGGKDSLATCVILHWLDIPFRTITAEVWWKDDITGENPYHYEFMHEVAFPKLSSWGCECHTVRSDITAYGCMVTPISRAFLIPKGWES